MPGPGARRDGAPGRRRDGARPGGQRKTVAGTRRLWLAGTRRSRRAVWSYATGPRCTCSRTATTRVPRRVPGRAPVRHHVEPGEADRRPGRDSRARPGPTRRGRRHDADDAHLARRPSRPRPSSSTQHPCSPRCGPCPTPNGWRACAPRPRSRPRAWRQWSPCSVPACTRARCAACARRSSRRSASRPPRSRPWWRPSTRTARRGSRPSASSPSTSSSCSARVRCATAGRHRSHARTASGPSRPPSNLPRACRQPLLAACRPGATAGDLPRPRCRGGRRGPRGRGLAGRLHARRRHDVRARGVRRARRAPGRVARRRNEGGAPDLTELLTRSGWCRPGSRRRRSVRREPS